MRKVAMVLSLVALVAVLAGCGKGPYDVGLALAKEHTASGFNPSQAQQARIKTQVEQETASYTMEEKMEFMKGYMEGIMTAATAEMGSQMNQLGGGLPGAVRSQPVQDVRRSLPPPRDYPQRQW